MLTVDVVEVPKPWCTPRNHVQKFRDGKYDTSTCTSFPTSVSHLHALSIRQAIAPRSCQRTKKLFTRARCVHVHVAAAAAVPCCELNCWFCLFALTMPDRSIASACHLLSLTSSARKQILTTCSFGTQTRSPTERAIMFVCTNPPPAQNMMAGVDSLSECLCLW